MPTIDEQNEAVLRMLSAYLNETPCAIRARDVSALTSDGLDETYAYALLLSALCGLDVAQSAGDRALFRSHFLPMTRRLDISDYANDPYARRMKGVRAQKGAWTLCHQRCEAYEAFVCDDFLTLPDGRVLPQIGFFAEPFDYPAVLENDRLWMSVTPNEINTMRAPIAQASGRVLTYGLGLGYFALMAAMKPYVSSVTVIEQSSDVVSLYETVIKPRFNHTEKINVIVQDAFDYAERMPSDAPYDFIFADLWHDAGDGLPMYLRLKQAEQRLPRAQYMYWIEQTLNCYLA